MKMVAKRSRFSLRFLLHLLDLVVRGEVEGDGVRERVIVLPKLLLVLEVLVLVIQDLWKSGLEEPVDEHTRGLYFYLFQAWARQQENGNVMESSSDSMKRFMGWRLKKII